MAERGEAARAYVWRKYGRRPCEGEADHQEVSPLPFPSPSSLPCIVSFPPPRWLLPSLLLDRDPTQAQLRP